ncbi:hypothetical protein HAX54_001867, partial [Datura stramonium]|nr:hypothetical protein [Datura stramonium]
VELRRGEHCRTVLGKPSPRPPSVCGVLGTLCRGHTERQVAVSRATRASGREVIEWFQKKGLGHPYTNWSGIGAVLLISPRQGETSRLSRRGRLASEERRRTGLRNMLELCPCNKWHPVPREHRAAGGRESGNSGKWPCTRTYAKLGGGSLLRPWFRGMLWQTIA